MIGDVVRFVKDISEIPAPLKSYNQWMFDNGYVAVKYGQNHQWYERILRILWPISFLIDLAAFWGLKALCTCVINCNHCRKPMQIRWLLLKHPPSSSVIKSPFLMATCPICGQTEEKIRMHLPLTG